MKPKIDLDSPLAKLASAIYHKEVKKAWEMLQSVEKAVIPISSLPFTKPHQKKKLKPIQTGTGVIVQIKDQFFIFSATHVFENFNDMAVLTSGPGRNQIEQISGERFSTGNLITRVDKFDATVFHIQSEISQALKNLAITLEDFDIEGYDPIKPIFMITGFLAKESNTAGHEIRTRARNFPTMELDDYEGYGYEREGHILLSYENQVLVNNKWQLAPTPRGMSGGAIIKAQGTNLKDFRLERKEEKQLLSGITIEQHRDKGNKLGFVLGTRVNVFLGLIQQFIPDLLEEFLEKQK